MKYRYRYMDEILHVYIETTFHKYFHSIFVTVLVYFSVFFLSKRKCEKELHNLYFRPLPYQL